MPRGKTFELEDGLLYGALGDALGQAIHRPGFAGVSDVWLGELARLLPELRERYRDLPSASVDPDPGGRRRLFEAVAQVFVAVAYEEPVVCFLDDLHWADGSTVELLHYLSRRLCAERVLFVVCLRPGEASPTLLRLKEVLVREHGGTEIRVEPLERIHLPRMLASMPASVDPPAEVADVVWHRCRGSPHLIQTYVESLADQGFLGVDGAGWRLDDPRRLPSPREGPGAAGLVRGRVERLQPLERALLEYTAAVGRAVTVGGLARIAREPRDVVRRTLEALTAAHLLVRREGPGGEAWQCAHDSLRDGVHAGIEPERSAGVHGRIALSATDGAHGPTAGALARHSALAGRPGLAVAHALESARWARSVFAYEGEREMLEFAPEHDRDPERRGRTARLRELGVRPRRRRRAAVVAAASVAVAALLAAAFATPWTPSASVALETVASLAPLPEGLLVEIDDGGPRRFGIVPPDDVRAWIALGPDELRPGPTPSEQVLLSPGGDRIAYSADVGGDPSEVFVAARDGRDLVRLTRHPPEDRPLSWLPDGSGLLVRSLRGDPRGGFRYR